MGTLTLWGLLLALKTIATGLCFGMGFYAKDALIKYVRERKLEIESNIETGIAWYHNEDRQISREWRAQHIPNPLTLISSKLNEIKSLVPVLSGENKATVA